MDQSFSTELTLFHRHKKPRLDICNVSTLRYCESTDADHMDLNQLPDEFYQDIFIYLGYVTQLKLRRTCKRWLALLRSPWVLQTIVFLPPPTLPHYPTSCSFPRLKSIIMKERPLIKTVIFNGEQRSLVQPPPVDDLNWMKLADDFCFWHFSSVFRLFVDGDEAFQSVVFANISASQRCLFSYFFHDSSIQSVTVRNCVFSELYRDFFESSVHDRRAIDRLVKEYSIVVSGTIVLLLTKGSIPVQWGGFYVMKKLAEASVLPLSDTEMVELHRNLPTHPDARKVMLAFLEDLCTEWSQPGEQITVSTDLTTIDFSCLKPIIVQLLRRWLTAHAEHLNSPNSSGPSRRLVWLRHMSASVYSRPKVSPLNKGALQ